MHFQAWQASPRFVFTNKVKMHSEVLCSQKKHAYPKLKMKYPKVDMACVNGPFKKIVEYNIIKLL